jgi:hypothetical protein
MDTNMKITIFKNTAPYSNQTIFDKDVKAIPKNTSYASKKRM